MITGYELLREAGDGRSPSVYNVMPFNDYSGIWLEYGTQNGKLRNNFVPSHRFQGGTIETAMKHIIATKEKEGYSVVRKGLTSVFGNYIRFPRCTHTARCDKAFEAQLCVTLPMDDEARTELTLRVSERLRAILRDVQGVEDVSIMSSSSYIRMLIRHPTPFPLTVVDLDCRHVNLCIRREHGVVGFCTALLAHYFPDEIRLFDRNVKEMPVSFLPLADEQHYLDKLESLGIASIVRSEPCVELGAWFF